MAQLNSQRTVVFVFILYVTNVSFIYLMTRKRNSIGLPGGIYLLDVLVVHNKCPVKLFFFCVNSTGCIIFEALPHHLKVHSYYTLLDHSKTHQFEQLLHALVQEIPNIKGLGISGFMKLPYKDTRFFEHSPCLPEKYYPRNPRAEQREKNQHV